MRKTFTLIALMLMVSVSAFAQITAVPQLMNFSGRLARPDGTPIADGTYSIRFSLWTAQTGGTEKWNQTLPAVTVKNGTFSVPLNTSTGAADKFNNHLFLEIKIGNQAPLTPRQPLASVAYAMKADSVKDGSITASSLANNAVTGAKIADGTITAADLANGSVTSAKLDSSLQGMLGGFTSDTAHIGLVGTAEIGGAGKAVAVSGNYAYVIAGSGPIGALLVYDVSNPTAPAYKASIVMLKPQALAVSGNYAYVITGDGSNLLATFDISNPANPVWKGDVATGNNPVAIASSGNRVYVVNQSSSTLQIFSISNPAAPALAGSIATATHPTAVAASGNYAYVTNRAGGSRVLQSFDVSNAATPVAKSSAVTNYDPNYVTVSGNYAYVTHQIPGGPLQIFDITNRAAPAFVTSIPTGGYPLSVAVSGPYAFVVCSDGFFQVFDVSSPYALKYLEGINCGYGSQSVAVGANYVCMVDRGRYVNGVYKGKLHVFERRTRGLGSNFMVQGSGFFRSNVSVDQGNFNDGSLANALTFGSASGEGIASRRTFGSNQWGLDFYTKYIPRLSISNFGYVGIGTTTPQYPLEVNGTVAAPYFHTTSDVRYKQNVAALENPLDTILNLRGVTYEWKQKEFPDKNFAAGKQIGFIAQEVEKILPELVSTDMQGFKSVAYQNVVPVLVEAVKAQQKQHKKDRADIQALQTEIAELKALLQRLAEQQKAEQK